MNPRARATTFFGRSPNPRPRSKEDMEKTIQNVCPKCGESAMNVYYEDDSDMKLGAWCESCDLKGFFVGRELFEVTELRARIPTRTRRRVRK